MVAQISTKAELNEFTGDANKLTVNICVLSCWSLKSHVCLQVIDFTASWCPPCQAIKPIFEALANQNADVNFLKVDLSEGTNDLATEYSVTAMSVSIVWKSFFSHISQADLHFPGGHEGSAQDPWC
jgi:thiol-disulfide isomerase/thioredoxin